jgi:cell division protein FtsQ
MLKQLKRKPVNRRHGEQTLLEWLRSRHWRRIGMVAAGVCILGTGMWALRWVLNQPINQVTIVGQLRHVPVADLQRVARRLVAGHGLVNVPVANLRRALRQLPWVEDVAIERVWPRDLRLHVREQRAVARWNVLTMINARGETFSGGAALPGGDLPLLAGPEGTAAEVFARFLQSRVGLEPLGLAVSAMSVDARGAWELRLANGITVRLGRSQVDARYQRLLTAAWPAVAERAADVNYLDLRYSNGFAVGWKRKLARLAAVAPAPGKPDA